uniref:RxLR effector protein n=1 Tax=Phytophthora fragariae TaxID=53985 RepID=A0A6A3DMG5_9STRA|nr:hypothetical protein PF009_g30462 [Phytophthora fragariae]
MAWLTCVVYVVAATIGSSEVVDGVSMDVGESTNEPVAAHHMSRGYGVCAEHRGSTTRRETSSDNGAGVGGIVRLLIIIMWLMLRCCCRC